MANGGNPEYEIIDDENYLKTLDDKLLEECNEVLNAADKNERIEELADLLEVIIAEVKALNVGLETIEKSRLKKLEERGGFDSKIFLKITEVVDICKK